jgi:hypothetical protein
VFKLAASLYESTVEGCLNLKPARPLSEKAMEELCGEEEPTWHAVTAK